MLGKRDNHYTTDTMAEIFYSRLLLFGKIASIAKMLQFASFSIENLCHDASSACRFCSVVAITFASHAKGPQFETGQKHCF